MLDTVAEMDGVSVYTRKQCKALATHLDNMRYEPAGKAIYRILNYMGYQEFMDSHGLDNGKAEILKALGDQENSLFDFPARLKTLQEMIREGCGDPKSNFILSTIHSSKGLEYDRVYLADMLAGVIPSQIPQRSCAPDSPEVNAYEEERRLYYVGMTRAKEQLYVFTFGPNLTSAFSREVFDKKVQKMPSKEVEACICACGPGRKILHQKYGDGRIVSVSGDGSIAEILFEGEDSTRKISLPIAFAGKILTLK